MFHGFSIPQFWRSPSEKALRDEQRMKEMLQFIQENYGRNITLEDVCGTVGFSSAYFSALFKIYPLVHQLGVVVQNRLSRYAGIAGRPLQYPPAPLNQPPLCRQPGRYARRERFTCATVPGTAC